MPSLKKLLSRFSKQERIVLGVLIEKLISLNWRGLDIKKLTGHRDIFRVRKGNLRIIFAKEGENISLIAVERRREHTYKKF